MSDIALVQARTLTDSALKQAAIGKAEQADRTFSQVLKVTKIIRDNRRDEVLKAFASEIAEKGHYDQALEFVRSIQSDSDKQRALEAIAPHLTTAQQYNQALKIAQSLDDNYDRGRVLEAIARYRKSP